MKNPFKSLLHLFNLGVKKNINIKEEQKALQLRKEKIEKEIKSRAYIAEINQRYNKLKNKKRTNFFRKAS